MLKNLAIVSFKSLSVACQIRQSLAYFPICSSDARRFYSIKKDRKKKNIVHLSDDVLSELINIDEYKQNLEAIINLLNLKYTTQITIEKSLGSLNEIQIEKDKKIVHLNEIAQINMKTPDLYIVNMSFNPELIPRVEKALTSSGMNLGIQKEGNTIYVSIPRITREYKENLAKSAKTLGQKSKEQIKENQNNIIKQIALKEKLFSHDIILGAKLKVQDIGKMYCNKIDEMIEDKKKHLLAEL